MSFNVSDFESLREKLARTAKDNIEKNGKLTPVAIIITPSGVIPVILDFQSKEDKSKCCAWLKAIIKKDNAIAVFLALESWIKTVDKVIPNIKNLADDPNKEEAVVLIWEDITGDKKTAIAKINRSSEGKKEKVSIEAIDWSAKSMGGLFSNFFDDVFARKPGETLN